MTAKNAKIIRRLTNIIISLVLVLITGFCLLKIMGAFMMYNYEKSCASEIYNMESLSPNGPSESWEEMQSNIQNSFSVSWEDRLVSGQLDVITSILLVLLLIATFAISLYVVIDFLKNFKKALEKSRQS